MLTGLSTPKKIVFIVATSLTVFFISFVLTFVLIIKPKYVYLDSAKVMGELEELRLDVARKEILISSMEEEIESYKEQVENYRQQLEEFER